MKMDLESKRCIATSNSNCHLNMLKIILEWKWTMQMHRITFLKLKETMKRCSQNRIPKNSVWMCAWNNDEGIGDVPNNDVELARSKIWSVKSLQPKTGLQETLHCGISHTHAHNESNPTNHNAEQSLEMICLRPNENILGDIWQWISAAEKHQTDSAWLKCHCSLWSKEIKKWSFTMGTVWNFQKVVTQGPPIVHMPVTMWKQSGSFDVGQWWWKHANCFNSTVLQCMCHNKTKQQSQHIASLWIVVVTAGNERLHGIRHFTLIWSDRIVLWKATMGNKFGCIHTIISKNHFCNSICVWWNIVPTVTLKDLRHPLQWCLNSFTKGFVLVELQ